MSGLRPSEVLRRAERYLEVHGVESPRATAEILLQDVLHADRASLYSRSRGLSSTEARAFGRALCRRCTGTPVQHLTGRQAFGRLDLEVRPGVFVPRPETEVVVEVAIERLDGVEAPMVLDVGTGTGAIALSIASEVLGASVWATDLSPDAASLARRNAEQLGFGVTVLEGDLFSTLPTELEGSFDVIVSNPPYVAPEAWEALPPEVRSDPELALLGGTAIHRRLAEEAPKWLRPGGWLVLEIGAEQGEDVASILTRGGFRDVEVTTDLAGRDRVVAGAHGG
jgi:release factor glutamine methyltransferase